ncbi:hypothetical protein T552_00888 [Pneumocystis carinii B80]|uniref:EF-hand domain-containing protein n=1 Tax=Pneumocystis carinii (strain B80) TaxID=1408658 RepID=A0A0W4ZMS7_PNEC8|nr:hypothetical protein T552_00888 [Pneumocystis carinii B80]KTW29679.1 hypothetical protein T552_00888 [Pneumocystis carinii B80]
MEENPIEDYQLKQIKDKFDIFDKKHIGKIKTKDLPLIIHELDIKIDKNELNELKNILDNERTGWIEYEPFKEMIILKIKDNDPNLSIIKAFSLFDKDSKGKITLEDLRRVANDIGEKVSDEELIEMIDEASPSGYVGIVEFENIMKRAGVF